LMIRLFSRHSTQDYDDFRSNVKGSENREPHEGVCARTGSHLGTR
jgi:hypothetical protein